MLEKEQKYSVKDVGEGIRCSDYDFEDPIPGTRKQCFCEHEQVIDIGPEDKCAEENNLAVDGQPVEIDDMCQCTGTVYYGTWESIELSGMKEFAKQEVNGQIKCDNESFGDPVWGTHKSCYCQHKNPSFLDEELQFNVKLDMKNKSAENHPWKKKEDGGIKIEFKNQSIKVNTLKHDRLARRDTCWVNFSLEEIKSSSTGKWELFMNLS